MAHLKDEIRKMNKGDGVVSASLRKLADICEKAYENGTGKNKNNAILKEKLFDGAIKSSGLVSCPKHNGCIRPLDSKETEKRICRCMYYFEKNEEICKECPLTRKWKKDGENTIEIIDYEVPKRVALRGVGGIDLLFKEGDKEYAVEIKRPEGNTDSISLMFAEIMTYTCETDYEPAIAVFENGFHHRKIVKLIESGNEDFIRIRKYIKIFYIKYHDEGELTYYRVVPLGK